MLTVTADEVRTFVYVRAGVPVFAEEGTHGETLGRLLLRQRVLSQEQYVEIIAKMTDALFMNEQLRFGEVAIELGHLTEAQVTKALSDQVRWKIVRIFQRPEVTWSFEESLARLEDVGNFPMEIEGLVLDAVRWIDDEQKLEMGLRRALDRKLRVDPALAPEHVARFGLTVE